MLSGIWGNSNAEAEGTIESIEIGKGDQKVGKKMAEKKEVL